MSEDSTECSGESEASDERTGGKLGRLSRRGVLAATGGALAASSVAGLASAQDEPETVQVELDEPLGTSSPSSPIAPADGFADTEWMTDGPLTVVPVTNLQTEGDGSIDHAMTRDIHDDSVGRIVVFEVGGVIDLAEAREFDPETSNVYVAGQTAPEPGITFIKGSVELDGDNIFVQHIRSRAGTETAPGASGEGDAADSLTIADESTNVIVDHCTASWGTDENLSSGDTASNVTFSNNLIAHGLAAPGLHPDGEEHSNGTLIGHDTEGMAILGNLYAHNNDRNPRLKGGTRSVVANNVVYNYDTAVRLGDDAESNAGDDYPTQASIVSNVYRPGDNTPTDDPVVDINDEDDVKPVKVYLHDNVTQGSVSMLPEEPDSRLAIADEPPVWPENFQRIGGNEVFGAALKTAGAQPAQRVPYDEHVVETTRDRSGEVIDRQDEVGGYPDYEPTTRELDIPSENFAAWLEQYTRAVET